MKKKNKLKLKKKTKTKPQKKQKCYTHAFQISANSFQFVNSFRNDFIDKTKIKNKKR